MSLRWILFGLFADAEFAENLVQQVFAAIAAADARERGTGVAEAAGDEVLAEAVAQGRKRRVHTFESGPQLFHLARAGVQTGVKRAAAGDHAGQRFFQLVQPQAL